METKICPECTDESMLFVTLRDADTFLEVCNLVRNINPSFYKEWSEDYLGDYWEGCFCFSCGHSEIKPVAWEK